jgi:prepilin signal peptidase PulO-like enzyme (type II secretory pathway)
MERVAAAMSDRRRTMVRIIVFSVFTFLISAVDAKTYRIPDPLLTVFLGTMAAFNLDKSYVFQMERIAAGAICYFLFFYIYRLTGGLGYGDVKYAAVLGYALGIEKASLVFVLTAFGGAALYLAGKLVFRWDRDTKIPFAPLLGFGSIIAVIIGNRRGI